MGSIPGKVMQKFQKMVRIKGKVEQFRERSTALSYTPIWLFEFQGMSATMGYSMPNLVYIYECYMIRNHFFV